MATLLQMSVKIHTSDTHPQQRFTSLDALHVTIFHRPGFTQVHSSSMHQPQLTIQEMSTCRVADSPLSEDHLSV